jgi:predicted DNA-binding protein (MmcQ/YjbR family)
MQLNSLLNYSLSLKGVEETFPFDKTTLVVKVGGKMFLLVDIDDASTVNLKCDPEKAIELRETYSGILPGYHMNKKHWNTVTLVGDVDDQLIFDLVKHSYQLVIQSLPKKLKDEFAN